MGNFYQYCIYRICQFTIDVTQYWAEITKETPVEDLFMYVYTNQRFVGCCGNYEHREVGTKEMPIIMEEGHRWKTCVLRELEVIIYNRNPEVNNIFDV